MNALHTSADAADLPVIEGGVLEQWRQNRTLEKSVVGLIRIGESEVLRSGWRVVAVVSVSVIPSHAIPLFRRGRPWVGLRVIDISMKLAEPVER